MDDLEQFIVWWRKHRAFNTPKETQVNFSGNISGVVLYRKAPYQVQLFVVKPNSIIEQHVHPNVDSFEIFLGGDIKFVCDGVEYPQDQMGASIRIKPECWHGGTTGDIGGSFLSVQKWINGVEPKDVGQDWADKSKNVSGTAIDIT